MVLCVAGSKDLRIEGLSREETKLMQDMVQLGFCSKNKEDTLRVYAVDVPNLKPFTNVSKKYAFESLPDERFRLPHEEIQGRKDLAAATAAAAGKASARGEAPLEVDMD